MTHIYRSVVLLVVFGTLVGNARATNAPSSIVTATRVAVAARSYSGPLYVTVGGRETKIAADAIAAWIIDRGRRVVYSGRDGSGGYENEGQSLRVYDARTGR